MELASSLVGTIFILALLLASWLLGYYSQHKRLPGRLSQPDPDYFVGLNYLLNDEPDDAIDVFIDALEINTSTLETHLALGTLLRRRGKVDRSIEHYEMLLAEEHFSSRQVNEIKIQLVRSFIAAGLLDRAEALLAELTHSSASFRSQALKLSVMVYQIEKDWQQALEHATELLKITPAEHRHTLLMQISHFHCEIAEDLLEQGNIDQAREYLNNSLRQFKGNVRVYILLGRVEYESGNYREAVSNMLRALQLDPMYFGEVSETLQQYLAKSGADEPLAALQDMQHELKNDSVYQLEQVRQRYHSEGSEAALVLLIKYLGEAPSLDLLEQAMRMTAENDMARASYPVRVLEAGADVIAKFLQRNPHYRCENCGFELKKLHWSCPGCNFWGMVRPIDRQLPQMPDGGGPVN